MADRKPLPWTPSPHRLPSYDENQCAPLFPLVWDGGGAVQSVADHKPVGAAGLDNLPPSIFIIRRRSVDRGPKAGKRMGLAPSQLLKTEEGGCDAPVQEKPWAHRHRNISRRRGPMWPIPPQCPGHKTQGGNVHRGLGRSDRIGIGPDSPFFNQHSTE